MYTWKRIHSPEVVPHIQSVIRFSKYGTKAIRWGKKFFQQVVLELLGDCKKTKTKASIPNIMCKI